MSRGSNLQPDRPLYAWSQSAILASHLPWIEGLHSIPLHEKHVDEVDEDAWSLSGVLSGEDQPLVEYHEHQVAK